MEIRTRYMGAQNCTVEMKWTLK